MNTREEFLKARQNGIGGSDIGAILGASSFKTAYDVYVAKTSDPKERTETDYQYWGHALENVIIDRFEQDNNVTVFREPKIKFHPQHKWALANCDGLVLDAEGKPCAILEIKTSSAFKMSEWGDEDTDQVPLAYNAQVQWYMAVHDLPIGYLAVLIGGNQYRQYTIKRDDELIELMLKVGGDFWNNHVMTSIPPEPKTESDVIKAYPNDDGDLVEADTDALICYNELTHVSSEIKALEEKKKGLELTLKTKIGAKSGIQLEGKNLVTWKTQSATRLDQKAFKEAMPETYLQFAKQSQTRVLRVNK